MPARPDASGHQRLVFLHGFTQTHHHWHRVAHRVADHAAERFAPVTLAFVDLPGHGLSGDDDLPIDAAGDPLAALAGRGTYVGYSMGGRFALHAAIAAPDRVERLVLIGATPGIEDDAERAERRRADRARADRVETIGVDAFLDEWLAAPIFATLPPDERGRAHRRRNRATGLAASLRTAGTGEQASLWPELARVDAPTLVLAGALDTKFTDIGRRMAARLPDATFVPIEGAGHAAHTERPDAVAEIIAGWMGTTPDRTRHPSASPIENRTP